MQPADTSSFEIQVPHFKLGNFTGLVQITEGGEGETLYYRKVAVKSFSHAIDIREMKETEILVKTKHLHIVQLFGILVAGSKLRKCIGYVMEFMRLGSLGDVIHDASISYDLKHMCSWIEQAGRGLNYLHDLNIIHRDIKPNNMLLNSIDHLKLADFGISREIVNTSITGGHPYYALNEVSSFTIGMEVVRDRRPTIDLTKLDEETEKLMQRGWIGDPSKRIRITEIIDFAQQKLYESKATGTGYIVDKPTILIMGKLSRGYCQLRKDGMYILNDEKSEWKTLSLELPNAIEIAAAVCLNEEIYVFGPSSEKYNNTYKLNEKMEWVRMGDMTAFRDGIANSSLVFDGCIWVFGGSAMLVGLNTVEKYIPEKNKWIKMPEMKAKRMDAAAAVFDGKIYVSGGRDDRRPMPEAPLYAWMTSRMPYQIFAPHLKTVECFDPNSNIWTSFMDLPDFCTGHAMVSDGSHLIVVGGRYDSDMYMASWKCETNCKTNPNDKDAVWETLPPLDKRRSDTAAAYLDKEIYVVGGYQTDTVEIFDGANWRYGPELPGEMSSIPSMIIPPKLAASLFMYIDKTAVPFNPPPDSPPSLRHGRYISDLEFDSELI